MYRELKRHLRRRNSQSRSLKAGNWVLCRRPEGTTLAECYWIHNVNTSNTEDINVTSKVMGTRGGNGSASFGTLILVQKSGMSLVLSWLETRNTRSSLCFLMSCVSFYTAAWKLNWRHDWAHKAPGHFMGGPAGLTSSLPQVCLSEL